MIRLFWTFIFFTQFLFSAECEHPRPIFSKAVEIVKDTQHSLSQKKILLENYLSGVQLSKFAVNEDCQSLFVITLREERDLIGVLEKFELTPKDEEINQKPTPKASYTNYEYVLKYGSLGLIQELKSKGGRALTNKSTDLMFAASKNTIKVIRGLIDSGEDVNAINFRGLTTLHYASHNRNSGVTKFLINSGAKIEAKANVRKETPLVYGSAHKNVSFDFLKTLIEEGADVNSSSNNRITPLIATTLLATTSSKTYLKVPELLINQGAKLNDTDKFKENALHLAVRNNKINEKVSIAVFELLIKNGININGKNSHGDTPLSLAVYHKAPMGIINLLLNAGALLNEQNNDGSTPLFFAALNKDRKLYRKLVKAGANKNIKDHEGEKASHYFKKRYYGLPKD